MVWSSGQEVRHKSAIPAKLTRAIHRRRRTFNNRRKLFEAHSWTAWCGFIWSDLLWSN